MFKGTITIGSMNLSCEAQSMQDIFKWSGLYANLPKKCDACSGDSLYLSYKNPSGNDYYSLKCIDCGAEGNFGQHKEGGSLYWKWETKLEKYVKTGNGSKKAAPEEDLPF